MKVGKDEGMKVETLEGLQVSAKSSDLSGEQS